jgi:hypothetical protein
MRPREVWSAGNAHGKRALEWAKWHASHARHPWKFRRKRVYSRKREENR